jgi:hypothetical protein
MCRGGGDQGELLPHSGLRVCVYVCVCALDPYQFTLLDYRSLKKGMTHWAVPNRWDRLPARWLKISSSRSQRRGSLHRPPHRGPAGRVERGCRVERGLQGGGPLLTGSRVEALLPLLSPPFPPLSLTHTLSLSLTWGHRFPLSPSSSSSLLSSSSSSATRPTAPPLAPDVDGPLAAPARVFDPEAVFPVAMNCHCWLMPSASSSSSSSSYHEEGEGECV